MAGDCWKAVTIDQIKAETDRAIAIGPFGSRMKSDLYTNDGVPVIRGNNITDTRVLGGDFVYVADETADELSSSNVLPGDLVFPHRGAIGLVGIVPFNVAKRYIMSTSMMKLTCNTSIVDPLYIYYFFRSTVGRHELLKHASTVGTPGIGQPLTSLRSISLRLPERSEQRAIAHILGTLDDKIELNRRTNETLEAMARALFKSWFADFDPVRAKARGQDVRLPRTLASLFPGSFENSESGAIPAGWFVQSLSQLSNIYSGGTPSKSVADYWGGELPWISPKAMTAIHVDRSDEKVTPMAIGNGTRLVSNGSVLVMVRGMGLHQGVRISQARRDVTFNQDVKAFVPKWGDGTFLLFALLDASAYLFSKVQASGHGTGVLPTDILEGMSFPVPPPGVREKLTKPLSDFNAKIAANSRMSEILASLRDTLLPKLISGELRVKDAERIVERVA
ncbi:MAG: restriction endonuclease subunit S [Rhodoplanes sp.]|uniref:restriction endonuclease subunit S n=1 Tax=Rhodoplanes sp. TaxID=1968906 RepID=UPI001827C72B|nr:restriction endonuclease subunit S [Rhodoplanes sp.]NVO14052.1 restriction endonuclease subunit S [Rhodoplanes sp.]